MRLPRFHLHKVVLIILLFVGSVSMPCTAAAFTAASGANALDPGKDPGPSGEWRGDSTCTIKDSPCHDEIVVYRIKPGTLPNTYLLDASKIVSGKREFMCTLECSYEPSTHVLACKSTEHPNGTWSFQINNGKRMEGTLVLDDKRLYRRISVARTKN
jgi:hypothetical protein